MQGMNSYILCTTPRTGSTLLCDLLAASGVAGAPDSFFMADPDPVWARAWKLPARQGLSAEDHARAYLGAVRDAGRAATPIFGLRLMRIDLAGVLRMIDVAHGPKAHDIDRIRAAFGETAFIHLRREDKLAQAISMIKAEQTGLWHVAPDGREIERLSPARPPRYDAARIRDRIALLEREDAAWQAWFAREGIEPLRLTYEEVSADPARAVAGICTALSVTLPTTVTLSPETARLADTTSDAWARRYRMERHCPEPASTDGRKDGKPH